jgi:hypothetical protein
MEPQVTRKAPRRVLVDAATGRKPKSVARLRDWEYLERSMHRLICAWGRYFDEWSDMVTVHRQVWEQAECVTRLRQRLTEFPGRQGNLDQPVSPKLERLVNVVLDAPSHDDAIDGVYQILSNAITKSYTDYCTTTMPVHDAPTIALLQDLSHTKESMRLWRRDYRRRRPHQTEPDYAERINREIATCGRLDEAIGLDDGTTPAAPVGVNTDFKLPRYPARPRATRPTVNIMPYLHADFSESIEARRLFWMIGYMREMNLAVNQLTWIWDTPDMPWDFHRDISRHLWDESRHGDSGYSRMRDFGIGLSEVGFGAYGNEPWEISERPPLRPQRHDSEPGDLPASGEREPATPEQFYEDVFNIGMIAETGHFEVKREGYEDFRAGGDMESAEMMLFDIIDEQSHVQYAHKWLDALAERAGVDNSGYKQRAAEIRVEHQARSSARAEENRKTLSRDPANPAFKLYSDLLQRTREIHPLTNAATATGRRELPS